MKEKCPEKKIEETKYHYEAHELFEPVTKTIEGFDIEKSEEIKLSTEAIERRNKKRCNSSS